MAVSSRLGAAESPCRLGPRWPTQPSPAHSPLRRRARCRRRRPRSSSRRSASLPPAGTASVRETWCVMGGGGGAVQALGAGDMARGSGLGARHTSDRAQSTRRSLPPTPFPSLPPIADQHGRGRRRGGAAPPPPGGAPPPPGGAAGEQQPPFPPTTHQRLRVCPPLRLTHSHGAPSPPPCAWRLQYDGPRGARGGAAGGHHDRGGDAHHSAAAAASGAASRQQHVRHPLGDGGWRPLHTPSLPPLPPAAAGGRPVAPRPAAPGADAGGPLR